MEKWRVTFLDKTTEEYTTVVIQADDCREAVDIIAHRGDLDYTAIVSITWIFTLK